MASTSGRPRVSSVWKYFKYDDDEKVSICQLQCGEKECGRKFKGKFPTNLKGHLKKEHLQQFEEVKDEEARKEITKKREKSSASCNSKQPTLAETFCAKKAYHPQSHKSQLLNQKLAIFIGTTNVPTSLVENAEFQELLHQLDSRYSVPGRTKISKEIDKVAIKLKEEILLILARARLVNICADIWTKKGMTASFIGVTAHFFTTGDHKRHNITLAVRRMPSPHTADAVAEIVEAILAEWKIHKEKVHRILTDNGSNMIAAFKEQTNIEGEEELTTESDLDEESDDESDNEMEEDDDDLDLDSDTEVENYEQCEELHNIAFVGYKRTSCFVHTLQLVVKTFDKLAGSKTIMKRAHSLVKKVNKSTKATEMLIRRVGKKLISDCPTRWSSTFLMISRLLEVKPQLTSVLEELGWDNLPNSHWKMIEAMEQLLKPFAQYTTLTNAEESTTISLIIPVLMELSIHLDHMKKVHGLGKTAVEMKVELKRRIKYVTDPSVANFDPIYVTAICYTQPTETYYNLIN